MGTYLNPVNSEYADLKRESIFVDHSEMLVALSGSYVNSKVCCRFPAKAIW